MGAMHNVVAVDVTIVEISPICRTFEMRGHSGKRAGRDGTFGCDRFSQLAPEDRCHRNRTRMGTPPLWVVPPASNALPGSTSLTEK